ncbi:hypothetical protein [Nostoc sp.]|uniref:hypothetical protein n=1 Tax=Nostoc sp. TaxID=1180 RepID=UPI002FFBFD2F
MNGKPPVMRSLDEKFDSDRLKLETEFTSSQSKTRDWGLGTGDWKTRGEGE